MDQKAAEKRGKKPSTCARVPGSSDDIWSAVSTPRGGKGEGEGGEGGSLVEGNEAVAIAVQGADQRMNVLDCVAADAEVVEAGRELSA